MSSFMDQASLEDIFAEDVLSKVISLEAIRFQPNKEFGEALEAEIKALRSEGATRKKIKASKLTEITKKYTGLSINYVGDEQTNAYIMFPEVDSNHPFFTSGGTTAWTNTKETDRLEKKNPVMAFEVDLARGRVGGVISEIEHKSGIGLPLINGDFGFTVKECVAIILHEIGHALSFYEFYFRVMSTNYLLTHFAEDLVGAADDVKKAYVVKEYRDTGAALTSAKEMAKTDNADEVRMHVIADSIREAKSTLGVDIYDQRGWEQLADQYATRWGYGKEIVTGLDRMYNAFGMATKASWVNNVIGTVVMLGIGPAGWAISLMILLLADTQGRVYDEPKKRFEVIRKELISNMKVAKGDARKSIREDIVQIDEILKDYEDWRSVFQFVQAHFGMINGRRQHRSITAQQLTEYFANSEVNLLAQRFEE